MIWRILAAFDPQVYNAMNISYEINYPKVDILMLRDLDSTLSTRERAAVDEWLSGSAEYPVHIMRDHPWHFRPILGKKSDDKIICKLYVLSQVASGASICDPAARDRSSPRPCTPCTTTTR